MENLEQWLRDVAGREIRAGLSCKGFWVSVRGGGGYACVAGHETLEGAVQAALRAIPQRVETSWDCDGVCGRKG